MASPLGQTKQGVAVSSPGEKMLQERSSEPDGFQKRSPTNQSVEDGRVQLQVLRGNYNNYFSRKNAAKMEKWKGRYDAYITRNKAKAQEIALLYGENGKPDHKKAWQNFADSI